MKTVLFIPGDSGGPEFAKLLIQKRLSELGVKTYALVQQDAAHAVTRLGLDKITAILPYSMKDATKGGKVYQSLNPFVLLSEARKVFSEMAPYITERLKLEISKGNIKPSESLVVTSSPGLLFMGPELLNLGFDSLATTDPYFFLDLLGNWQIQKSQVFPALATPISRALFFGGGLLERLGIRNESWNQLISSLKGQIYSVSPDLCSEPNYTGKGFAIAGYPLEGIDQTVPTEVKKFITDSNKPVALFTLGSMSLSDEHREQVNEIIELAAHNSGFNLLVLGQGESTSRVMYYDSFVSYSSLMPLIDLVIFHGGSGTMHEVLRSGTPSIIIYLLGDQPAWAKTLEGMGLIYGSTSLRGIKAHVIERFMSLYHYEDKTKSNCLEFATTMIQPQNDGIQNAAEALVLMAN